MSRRVLITGAGGFVGAHLAEGFAALGDTVTALDRAFDAATRARLAGVTLIEAPLSRDSLDALAGFDLVIHGAAITTPPELFGISDTEHLRRNLDLLLTSLDYARASGVRDFVFLSSSGVYGEADHPVLLESLPAHGASPYALAKRAGELVLEGATGLRAIAVRLGPVYGPYEVSRDTRRGVSLVRQWLVAAHDGQALVVDSPGSERDWTFAPDLARAIDALLRQSPALSGVVHLVAPGVRSDIDLARMIGTPDVRDDGLPPRRPMSSERVDLANLIAWTPLLHGLELTRADVAR